VHTVKIIGAGLALLAVFALLGRWLGGRSAGAAKGALYFIAAWLFIAAGNMMLGVVSAGYSVLDELPIFLVVFAVPTGVALLVRRLLFGG
jgi:hypothetical protein